MGIDYTPLFRNRMVNRAQRTDAWRTNEADLQAEVLRSLLKRGAATEPGRRYAYDELAHLRNPYEAYRRRVPHVGYEAIRDSVMRMVAGERDVLWPGVCRDYAQSSGTSGGKSKYIPITTDCLRYNHYAGSADTVGHYLRQVPDSRIFSGKGFILGGSFANELHPADQRVKVGDLSATLISKMPFLADMARVPDRKTALLSDWTVKLPALVKAARDCNVTNISGVPSWFLTVIRSILKSKRASNLSEVWPNLEVFFHGGISFEPYRAEYRRLTDMSKMHFMETYNASEGFFGVQNDLTDPSLLLIADCEVFYEFFPIDGKGEPVPLWGVEKDRTYELVISASNGLWRYHLGDTVTVTQTAPVKIRIAGRTKSYINAFGEELMEDNAERAIAEACRLTGASIVNYTAAPVFASDGKRGRHQWLIEWAKAPSNVHAFAVELDHQLQQLNSDYEAKRANTIFLDPPEVLSAPRGLFDRWLASAGTHKLGGQRKVPRLVNHRGVMDRLLSLIG